MYLKSIMRCIIKEIEKGRIIPQTIKDTLMYSDIEKVRFE
jgi:hypothetical protein